jgi:hypothetical protein
MTWLYLGPGRSIRKAYRAWCEDNHETPKQDPPSTWYQVAKGRFAAFRKAEWQSAAIERAGEVHGRIPDWERLTAVAEQEVLLGKYAGEEGEIMDELTLLDFAFQSLAIDSKGNPIPGQMTWAERSQAYWNAVARGEVEAPQKAPSKIE